MINLTFVLDNFAGGGKERRCLQLIQGLLKLGGYEIQVILIDGDIEYKELMDCNISLVALHRKDRGRAIISIFRDVRKLIGSFEPDIVQAWGYMSAFYILPLSIRGRSKFLSSYVANVISPNTFRKKLINKLCCTCCSYIIGNSQSGLAAYAIPERKALCIYNGFNEERFARKISVENFKRDLGINTTYVVSMCASFSKNKDWQCYIQAAKIILGTRNDITFLGIGAGPDLTKYKNQLTESESQRIRLLGRRDDVDEILQITDVSVLCTNEKVHEGLSNSIMESMAWGVPVIATDGGGTPEIIEDQVNGLLIKRQVPEMVAEMIYKLIDDDKSRKMMGNAAKITINKKFLLTKMVSQYDELYRSIINDK